MIFGKTLKQREADEQARLKLLAEKRKKVFAFLPVKLHDGSRAWLQFVYKKHPVVKCLDGEYIRLWFSNVSYYLTEK